MLEFHRSGGSFRKDKRQSYLKSSEADGNTAPNNDISVRHQRSQRGRSSCGLFLQGWELRQSRVAAL
eukprot:symbB.v1.2.016400.t1/scaffold1217.1/size131114/1